MSVNELVNDNYIILKILYENQVTILNKKQIPITQLDVAKALGFSKNKVYSIFKMLRRNGYIQSDKKGKYELTDKAVYIVENLNKIEMNLNSKEKENNV